MRPVERGNSPVLSFKDYYEASSYLVDRLGNYCSYCERKIETYLAVEHILPKTPFPNTITEWSNFLLGCVNCNSCKGDANVNLNDYLWPDTDNTLLAFEYDQNGYVHSVNNAAIKQKAEKTISLVGLDKHPGLQNKPTSKDNRWSFRIETWRLAKGSLDRLRQIDNSLMKEQIIETAIHRGGFSIWYKVFENDQDMRLRFIDAFKGTAKDCFDSFGNLVSRPSGQI